MKRLNLLKTLVDLFLLFAILGSLLLLVFIPVFLLDNEPIEFPITFNNKLVTVKDFASKMILVCYFVAYMLFVYGIYLFRKVLKHFQKREIFHDNVILLLNRVGKLFLAASIVSVVVNLIYHIYIEGKVNFVVDVGADSFLIAASIGLFFMVLSEVFSIAKNMKEENELTI